MTKKIVRGLVNADGVRIGKIPGSYKVVNTETDEFYLGSSKTVNLRINKHRDSLLKGTHSNKNLQRSFDQAEDKNVFVVEVTPCPDHQTALRAEQTSLNDSYNDPKCLNIVPVSHGNGASGRDMATDSVFLSEKYQNYLTSRKPLTEEEETERRAKISVTSAHRWEDPEYRKNFISKNGDPVKVDGVSYSSVREACRALGGIAPKTLRAKMYPGADIKSSDLKRDNFKKVSVNGTVYNSVNEAASFLGIAPNTLTWRCQNTDPKWSGFFYV